MSDMRGSWIMVRWTRAETDLQLICFSVGDRRIECMYNRNIISPGETRPFVQPTHAVAVRIRTTSAPRPLRELRPPSESPHRGRRPRTTYAHHVTW